ncbi:MAG: alanine racemase [Candidatus Aminicenantes bacterium]|nr:alanine racemase [Candidatus Aminicenantes bacterium]
MNIDDMLLRPVWFEIDLDAMRHNFLEAQRLAGEDVKIICSLKCDAWGFGYLEAAEEVLSLGAYGVAVADLFEAINLRRHGIQAPILLYANNLSSTADKVVEFNLIPTVTDWDSAVEYSKKAPLPIDVYVKVDIGLNRIGVLPETAVNFVDKLLELENICVAGIYTHFHFSEDENYMNWQFKRFTGVLEDLEKKGIDIPVKMASATPSLLNYAHMSLNFVDPGRLIFGNPVVSRPKRAADLKPVFRSLKTRIVELKTLKPREKFSEQSPYAVNKDMCIGVIPVGWGDGYSRDHSAAGAALVRGKRVAVLGDVCFEHTVVDLTDVPEAKIGDEVVLIGKQGDEHIALEEIAAIRNTDLHEVCQSVKKHIPRLYWKNGKPFKLITPLGETRF